MFLDLNPTINAFNSQRMKNAIEFPVFNDLSELLFCGIQNILKIGFEPKSKVVIREYWDTLNLN